MSPSTIALDRFRRFVSALPDADRIALDSVFAEIAIAKGFVDPDEIQTVIVEHGKLRAGGAGTHLGRLLVQRGIITDAQLAEILAAQQGRRHVCPCGHVVEVALGRSGPVVCDQCGRTIGEAAPSVAPGARHIGRYRIVREVGRGAMGVVYEAEDVQLKRRVALKVLQVSDEVERFSREASIAAQVAHPNIVGVHEIGRGATEDGTEVHFIAMEFVAGETLAARMRQSAVPLPDLVRMLEEVSRAVGFAHSKGVIHRDLKPSNVLVEAGGRIVLTDFGLARANMFQTKLTQTSAVMGTPNYMAPEQIEGRTDLLDARTDVWALGVILYEMLTATMPFSADVPMKLYDLVTGSEPPAPRSVRRSVPRDLELVCLKALDKAQARRYANATELADDLARWRRGEPVLARPLGPAARALRALRRRPAVVVAAALAALLAGAVALVERTAAARLDAAVADGTARARDAFRRETDARRDALRIAGADLADSPRIKADLQERRYKDAGEIARYEVEYRAMPVDFVAVTTHQGRSIARFAATPARKLASLAADGRPPEQDLVDRTVANADEPLDGYAVDDGRLFQVAAFPILDGDNLRGVLVLGGEITPAVAARLREGLDAGHGVAYVLGDRLAAASLPGQSEMGALAALEGRLWSTPPGQAAEFDTEIDGKPHHVVLTGLHRQDALPVMIALYVSLESGLAAHRRVRATVLGAGAVVIAIAVGLVALLGRGRRAA